MATAKRVRRRQAGELRKSVFAPLPYQAAAIRDPSRFLGLLWSRQVGKSATGSWIINDAILDAEARGDTSPWSVVSQTKNQARKFTRKVANIGKAISAARKLLTPEIEPLDGGQFELRYPGGSIVTVSAARSAAGDTGNLLADELDLWPDQREAWATVFAIASRDDWRIIWMSTPRGKRLVYDLVEDSAAGGTWNVHRLNIHDAVAQGCPQDPELLKRAMRDPYRWRQEYLVEFLDDATAWLPWDMITAALDEDATLTPATCDDEEVYAGWDIARYHHLSVLWIARKTAAGLRPLGLLRMHNVTLTEQCERVAATLKRYPKFRRLVMDATGMGEMPYEHVRKSLGGGRVEGIKFGPNKEPLAVRFRELLEDRRMGVFDDEQVREDLHCVQCTYTSSGKPRFEGETKGTHADIFWAGAMCADAAFGGGVRPWMELVSAAEAGDTLGAVSANG